MARGTFALWEKIFQTKQFNVIEDLHFITPDEIKEITGKEPRLMAKMDSSADVPPIFKTNGYFLLSVGQKGYAIVRGNGFHELEKLDDGVERFVSRIKFNLTTSGRNTSEMQYLDYCANAGLMEHIAGDGTLYPSIRGREGSGSFSFRVGASNIEVQGAQIEVDLGLEGENKIVLLEAKSKTPEDFIIRQLYYPYRRFTNLSSAKEIMPIFFTYDSKEGTYNYWIYRFTDVTDYNSIRLVSRHSYRIVTADEFRLEQIQPEAQVKYKDIIPQANDLDKVMELVFKVSEGMVTAKEIAEYFNFDNRQSSYYREAAEALGYVYLEASHYVLTDTGRHLVGLGIEDRNIFFSRVLSNFKLVKELLSQLRNNGSFTKQDAERAIVAHSNLTGTTVGRRADSLMSWFRWIAEKTGTFVYDKGTVKLI